MEREQTSRSGRSAETPAGTGAGARGVKPLDWARAVGRAEDVARGIEGFVMTRRRARRRAAMTGAMLAAVVLAGGLVWRQVDERKEAVEKGVAVASVPATAVVSAPARQTLPDGSRVELKSGAEIAVEFTGEGAGARRVVLKRGEAHFTVAKNAARPFVVAAGGVEVRAVGTAFAMEWGAREVEVLVTEGRVAVEARTEKNESENARDLRSLAQVDAGNRAVVAVSGEGAGAAASASEAKVEAVSSAQLQTRLAWRVPRLEFNGTPLGEVVALFNEHAVAQANGAVPRLVVADEALLALPLSGTLRADNVSVLLRILGTSYGIEAETRSGGEVVLRKGR